MIKKCYDKVKWLYLSIFEEYIFKIIRFYKVVEMMTPHYLYSRLYGTGPSVSLFFVVIRPK